MGLWICGFIGRVAHHHCLDIDSYLTSRKGIGEGPATLSRKVDKEESGLGGRTAAGGAVYGGYCGTGAGGRQAEDRVIAVAAGRVGGNARGGLAEYATGTKICAPPHRCSFQRVA